MKKFVSVCVAAAATTALVASAYAMPGYGNMKVKTSGNSSSVRQNETVQERNARCRDLRGIRKAACLQEGKTSKRAVKKAFVKAKDRCADLIGIKRVQCLFKERGGKISSSSSSSVISSSSSSSSVSSSSSSSSSAASSVSSSSSSASSN